MFGTTGRSNSEILEKQKSNFINNYLLYEITNAIPDSVVVLNNNRQIVFANKRFLDFLELKEDSEIIGKRPGEALNCEHAFGTIGGCGTTKFCVMCGAFNSILSCFEFKADVQECRIIQYKTNKALDLRIYATPIQIEGELFTIFAMQDIQDEKRRKVLERIFFHDILNTAGGLKGISELIKEAESDELEEYRNVLLSLIEKLIDEIKVQRDLVFAENGELGVNISQFDGIKFLNEVNNSFCQQYNSKDKRILLVNDSGNITIETDRVLLWRVIINMLKNALEASGSNNNIKFGCRNNSGMIDFWVNNPSFIKPEIQLQIFQRSFSTKGAGRGTGTYSIKLLTERYLKGRAWFESTEKEGTTFYISIPQYYHLIAE
jgi:signal transduction histidine kinase